MSDVIEMPAVVLEALAAGRTDFVRLQVAGYGDDVSGLVLSICDLLDEEPEEAEVDYGDCPDCQDREDVEWDAHCPGCREAAKVEADVPDVDALSDVGEMRAFLKRFVNASDGCEGGVD